MKTVKKKLKIAQIAPLWVSIPPKTFGGIEKIVHLLSEELIKQGHRVTLFAAGNSKTSAQLNSIWPISMNQEAQKIKDKQERERFLSRSVLDYFNIAQALSRADEFDIIHSHIGELSLFFAPLLKKPILVTQHNPFFDKKQIYRYQALKALNQYQRYVSISFSQRKKAKSFINFEANIYNGIEVEKFKFNDNPKDYLFWIGRISQIKGLKEAIITAKKAKCKLLFAGPIDNKKLFNQITKNKSRFVEYLGELNFKEKVKIFGQAKALLYPLQWEEPFGLVMIEAMACGTPVIAFKRGAVKEVVADGKTGFVVPPFNEKGQANIKGLIEAIKNIDQIDRKKCRQYVEEKFSVQKMAQDYQKLYYQLIKW